MTNRANLPTDPDSDDADSRATAQAIPDGGLGSAMPAWLQEPPTWKRVPTATSARTIPAPDTTVIDPRTLLDIDDLPGWLQDIARRGAELPAPVAPVSTVPGEPESAAALPIERKLREPPGNVHRTLVNGPGTEAVSKPVLPGHADDATGWKQIQPSLPRHDPRPWWMSDGVIGGLLVAVILTMLYVILVASGAV
jgi:hypothetical protein